MWLNRLLEVCQGKDFSKVEEFVDEFLLEAFATSQLIEQLSDRIIMSDDFNDKQKAFIGEKLAVKNHFYCSLNLNFLILQLIYFSGVCV